MTTVDCVLDIRANLGEGAMWDEKEQALWWVDINAPTLNRFDPATGANRAWTMPRHIGCFAFRETSGLLVALRDGFHFFDPATETLDAIHDPEADKPDNRFNDGTPDPAGRMIAGTMPLYDRSRPTGAFYRLHTDLRCETLFDQVTVSNGTAFSPDGRIFYFADSPTDTIWACDYDPASGAIGNRREFATTRDLPSKPDGGTIDADGGYWIAGVNGWQLVRFTPDGRVDRTIEMPVERPTKIAFGGRDLDILYVTSIGHSLTPGTEAKQPQAGSLFALTVPGIRGLPTYRFAG